MSRLFFVVLALAISQMPFAISFSQAKEIDGDMPLTGISASLQPDPFTGILTGSIPIEVPPGRNGMQPNVMLSYESAGGNGWVGMGWKLEMGTIERQTRWGVLYQPTTADEQAGKVYTLRLNGVSTDLVQDATDPFLYHEMIKSGFLRIKKLSADGTAGWEITDTKGTKYKFGTGTTTRIQGTVGTLGMQIFKWCLERVDDRDGNYMTMTYTGDQGQGYLSQIDYTGNGAIAPTNQVKFYLEDRTDKPVMYTSNFAIATAKRLKTIEVKANGSLVRAVKIGYLQGNVLSFASSVQQVGKDADVNQQDGSVTGGTVLPDMKMAYKGSFPAVSFNSFVVSSHASNDYSAWKPTMADVNGDGRMDVVVQLAHTTGWKTRVALSNGNGNGTFEPMVITDHASNDYSAWKPTMADINGDGRMDVVMQLAHTTGWKTRVALSNGNGTFEPMVITDHASNDYSAWNPTMADVNGDGRMDVVMQLAHTTAWKTRVALSNGNGTFEPMVITDHASNDYSAWNPTMADINGDGRMDAVVQLTHTTGWHTRVATIPGGNDLIESITNGSGGQTIVQYTPSPQHSTTSTPAHPLLPYPVETVTSLTTCDNWNSTTSICAGNSSTTTFSYTGGYHHMGERDFRGFKTVTVTSPGASDADKTVTTMWFHQGNELNPVDTENPGLANGYMKGQSYRVEVRRKSDNLLYTKTETTYLADQVGTDTTAPWFTPLAQVDTSVCDGGPCTTTRVSYAAADYDAYGNLKKESHHGDLAVTGDEKTIERAFVPANTTDYLASFPTRETIYQGVPAGAKLAETLFYYDGSGTGTCTSAPTGSQTTITKGKLTKTERWLNGGTNPVSGMEYDATTGVLLCSRDPLGNKTTLTYDPTKTFVLSATNQLGHVTTNVYYGVNLEPIPLATGFYGAVKSVTDPNGKVVNHEYDALGRTTKTTAPDGLIMQVIYPTLAEFGVIGTQKISTTTSGALLTTALTSSTFFDGLGRTFKRESSGPNSTTLVTETQYDGKGQVFRTSLPYFKATESVTNRWRTMTYDAVGRVTQVTHLDTLSGTPLTTKTCYAPFVTVTLDPTGARKRETKDVYGRVVKVEEYSTTTSSCDTAVGTPYATTNYTYDLLGNLTKVVDTLGNRTTMRYDTLSHKIAMSDPDMSTNGTSTCADLTALTPNATYPWYAAPCWNYQYDAAGNLTQQTDAKSQHLWFRYDGLNRRTQKDFTTQKAQGSGDVVYTYDDSVTTFNRKGRLKQVVDAATNVTFEYDSMGRISKSSKVLDGTTYVTTSLYDGLGRLKEVTYPSNPAKTVEYLYTGPALEKVQDKAGSGTTVYATYSNYTSQGQAQTLTYGNGVITTNTFADPAHPTCIPANSFKLCTLKTQKGTNPVLQDLTYTFTADGNVDLITDPLNGNHDFGYDTLDRLTSATGPYGAGGATATLTYSYNQIGNLTNNSQLGAYTYPTSGAGVVRPHAVTAAGGNTYTYDNNGNMLTGAGRTYTWNFENKPLTTVQGGITTTFIYDGDGGRVKKIVGAITTRYISKLYECDNASCSRFIWAGSTRVATIAASGTIHYWHGDHLGSSSVITDSTGAKVQAVTYYPYGGTRTNQSFSTPAVDVPYKFTGQELDTTGLYYYEARYYDPTLGRFISADTIVPSQYDPQALNRYAYVLNNPLRYTDPTGHGFFDDFVDFFEGVGEVLEASFFITNPIAMTARIMYERPDQPGKWFSPTYNYDQLREYRQQIYEGNAKAFEATGARLPAQGLRELTKFENSRTGRYIEAGALVAGLAVGAAICGGCSTPAIGALIGGFVGAASGFAQAAYAGTDPLHATVIGGAYGAAGGAIGGAVELYGAPFLINRASDSMGMVHLSMLISEKGLSKFAGSVVGSSFNGGFTAIAKGENIGNGFGFGALGGAFGGAMAIGPANDAFSRVLGQAGSFGEYGVRGPARNFADGAVDWTGGWFSDQTK